MEISSHVREFIYFYLLIGTLFGFFAVAYIAVWHLIAYFTLKSTGKIKVFNEEIFYEKGEESYERLRKFFLCKMLKIVPLIIILWLFFLIFFCTKKGHDQLVLAEKFE